ncbi:MAG TPA: hypothetical protein PKD53_05595 [Chloroflexaceae bacterium]|nr:hypothetical protein [Chloroflexaceae bacterium]
MAVSPNRRAPGARPAQQSTPPASHWPGGGAWIETPFRASVRGATWGGERFSLDTVLDGLSPSFLALRLPWQVAGDRPLFVVIWLGASLQGRALGRGVATRGIVVRAEQRPGDVWRVIVKVTRPRFLAAGSG